LIIHHVLDSLAVGGMETVVAGLSLEQTAAGHEVFVHCLLAEGPLSADLHRAGIPVLLHSPARPRGAAALTLSLLRAFAARPRGLVHCHNTAAALYGSVAASTRWSKAVVVTRHGMSTDIERSERRFWRASPLYGAVVAVSEAARRHLSAEPWSVPDKLTMIYNGARPARRSAEADALARASGGPFTLLSAARLAPEKDFPTLLRAVGLLRERIPGIRLWIAGAGRELPSIEALIAELRLEDSVSLLGERHDVGSWLAAADLFVLSSTKEGLPIALLEAMAAGTPCVVTEAGGMPEVVALAGCGTSVPSRDPAALAGAIAALAEDPARRRAMGAAGLNCYQQHFTIPAMAQAYEELYRRLIA
jgi:glycosyltransferase involved in cell wall biosynthesis